MTDTDRDPLQPSDPDATPRAGDAGAFGGAIPVGGPAPEAPAAEGDPAADTVAETASLDEASADTVAETASQNQASAEPEPTAEERARAAEAAALARAAAIEQSTPPPPEVLAAMAAEVEAARPIPRPIVPDVASIGPDGKPIEEVKGPTRRRRFAGVMMRVASLLVGLALFVGGLGLGYTIYTSTRPPAPAIGDPVTGGVAAPLVVHELTTALASNDADALRSAVTGDPYRLLAGELQSWGMQGVTSVEILATMQDGARSATEIVVNGKGSDGQIVTFNLVVHVTDNQIVNFR